MSVYIGIPTVNNLKYLKQTLGSLKNKWKTIPILLVDNGSTDKVTRKWIENRRWDRILNPGNLGVAKAWNQIINWGLSHDDCELIFILNNDIILHPDCMDCMIESILKEGYQAISGINVGRKPVALESFSRPKNRYTKSLNFCCFGLTARTIRRVGLFDEGFKLAYFEDNDYHHRMKLEGIKMAGDMWAAFTHYGSRTIKEGGVKHRQYFKLNQERFIKKWGYDPQR